MLYVPRHLSNKLEYKVLSCISVHYQSRMTRTTRVIQGGDNGERPSCVWSCNKFPPTICRVVVLVVLFRFTRSECV